MLTSNSAAAPDESARLAAVRRYEVLDTPPDGAFDRITALAARRFKVPIAIVSVVDEDRIWFKSRHGLDITQIDRDPGLCASAILSQEPHILPDAAKDPRALSNPLVAGGFGLRFYVGVPLRTFDGHNLGTLCVIDTKPHAVEQEQIDDLEDLAAVVMDQLELQLAARRAVDHAKTLVREIDHRVMNSLQFVSGLLSMQSRAASAAEVAQQLEIAAGRVAAVARVHRHFSTDEPSQRVGCVAYLRRLCAELSGILEATIEVEGDDTPVPTQHVQPIGLIVNELLTNAAKHGGGTIKVRCAQGDKTYSLHVSDSGPGLPPDFDVSKEAKGLGMRVVRALSQQLGGKMSASTNAAAPGAVFSVTFPKVD